MTKPRWVGEISRRWKDAEGRSIAIEEITVRTINGQMMLTPTKRNNELIVGVLARAQSHYDFECYATSWMSNHGSYVISVRDAVHRAKIMEFVHGNIPKELGWHGDYGRYSRGPRPFRRRAKFWGRRGTPIQAMTDEDCMERVKYGGGNGVKEGLVGSPLQSVGVNSARELCTGIYTIGGKWVDRTKYAAMRKKYGEDYPIEECTTDYELKLSKLPHLRHLSDEAYSKVMRGICDELVEEARQEFGAHYRPPSARKLRDVNPRTLVEDFESTPAPRVFCSDTALKKEYIAAYAAFVEAYQIAHHELKACIREGRPFTGEFPPGGIRPTDLLGA